MYYIHNQVHMLCKKNLGKHLPVTGCLVIFTHYMDEFERLVKIRELITGEENYNNKYFKLLEPVHFEATDDIPEAVYKYLHIRKPDPYRAQVGDVDFLMETEENKKLWSRLKTEGTIPGIRPSPENHLELIELYDPDMDVLSYLDTMTMEELIKSSQ